MDSENPKSAAEQAWDSLMDGAVETPEPVEAAPEPVEAAPVEAAEPPEAEPTETATEKAARLRTPDGRFAETPKEKAAAAAAARAVKPTPSAMAGKEPAKAPAVEALKPPNSLKPTEREAFARAPKELQDFIIRRERDAAINHQKMAEAAKRGETWGQALSHFEPTVRARGLDPVAHTRNLLQAEHALQYGTRQQKAAVVHSLLTSYGVDVDDVNALLQGQPGQAQQQPQGIDPAQLRAMGFVTREELQQQAAQRAHAAAARDIAEFAKSRPYLEEVRPMMGDIMEASARRGSPITMEVAYNLACQSTPEVAAALARTKTANAPVSPSRVRAAAGSLKSRPLNSTAAATPKSAAQAAWDHLTGNE